MCTLCRNMLSHSVYRGECAIVRQRVYGGRGAVVRVTNPPPFTTLCTQM